MIYHNCHCIGGIPLKLTIDDLRRAIVNGGDVSCFAEVYDAALDGAPISVVSDFGRPLRLPSPYVLAEGVRRANDDPLPILRNQTSSNQGRAGELDLRLATLESNHGDSGQTLVAVIDDFSPDIIVLDRSREELSARALYTFSLPCAVGLSVRLEMIHGGAVEAHFNGDYRPGDPEETVIIESWRRRIPLLAVGRLPGKDGLTLDKDALAHVRAHQRERPSFRQAGTEADASWPSSTPNAIQTAKASARP